MNDLMNTGSVQMMSSKDIAGLTGKTIGNIHVDIKKMISGLKDDREFNHEQYQEVKDERGYTREFLLDKELSMTLVSGYNVKLRNAIIRRWQELESQLPKVPTTFLEAMELATKTLREKEKLQIENQVMQPKADSFDVFIDSTGYQAMNTIAKVLGVGRNKLFKFLRKQKVLMKNNIPYQDYCNRGFFVVRENVTANKMVFPQTFATTKGVDYIKGLLTEVNFEL